ncbi:MAG: PEP-CTERM sorting domain-containing protein [Planctomycetota bacterium]
MNRQMKLAAVLVVCGGLAAWTPAAVVETWESAPLQTVFDGNADQTWLGDIGAFAIEPADWPDGANVFAGEKAVRAYTIDATGLYTIVTDVAGEVGPSQATEWSAYASGNSIAIQSGYWFQMVLLANTSDVAAIESPDEAFAGYKLSVTTGDYLTLWKCAAGDAAWTALDDLYLGSAAVSHGWNFHVSRSADGQWTVSHANGLIGTPPVEDFTVADTSVDLAGAAWYSGMSWRTKDSRHEQKFGFDNFQVVPEPITLGLLALGGLALRRRR